MLVSSLEWLNGGMMSQYHFKKVRKLRASGLNKSQIARELKMDWKTVSKYWESNTPPLSQVKGHRRRIDPSQAFESRIKNLLENIEAIKPVDIFERLRKEGYTGCLRTIQRRVENILGELPKERFFEQEYSPGEQTQFDFKEKVELKFIDGMKIVNLHYGTLPYSGKTYVKGYPFLNFECFIDGIHSFFESIGGLTENIRIDNLSPCVKAVLKGRLRDWTDAFEAAIEYYDFGVLPCTPGKGNEKGHVERDIQTFTRRIRVRAQIDGIIFRDWNDLNQWLHLLMKEEQKGLVEKFSEDFKKFLPLPPRNREILCRVESCVATAYGTVRLGKSAYSVPDSAVGVACTVIGCAYEVKIFRSGKSEQPIAIHPRMPEGDPSILLEHILPSLIRKPQAMIRWAHRDILFPEPIFQSYYDYLKKIDSYAAEREFLRTINLVHYVDLNEIRTAIELTMKTRSLIPFDDVKALLLIERRPCVVTPIAEVFDQRPLQPELSQYDSLIPKLGAL